MRSDALQIQNPASDSPPLRAWPNLLAAGFILISFIFVVPVHAQPPTEVVSATLTAANEGRYADACQYFCSDLRRRLKKPENLFDGWTKNRSLERVDKFEEVVRGDQAAVSCKMHFKDGSEDRGSHDLVNENGVWKLAATGFAVQVAVEELLVRGMLSEFRKGNFKAMFDRCSFYNKQIARIRVRNPQVLWAKLEEEYYQSQFNVFESKGDSWDHWNISTQERGNPILCLRELARLLKGNPQLKAIESRREKLISGEANLRYFFAMSGLEDPTDIVNVYVEFAWPNPATAPTADPPRRGSNTKRLEKSILMFHMDMGNRANYIVSYRVNKGDVYWDSASTEKATATLATPPITASETQDKAAPTVSSTAISKSDVSVASRSQTPSPDPNQDWFKAVCPSGKPGEFRHGTKCVGYYETDEAKQKDRLVDIQVAGTATTKAYSKTKSLVHAGVDIIAPEKSDVFPIADGTVDQVLSAPSDKDFNSLGYMVIIEHKAQTNGKPTFSLYLHLKEKPKVEVGQAVTAGKTLLGNVGATGATFGAHLHLEIRHFPGRFYSGWNNIYGIERPKDIATFKEAEFAENWVNPETFALDGGISPLPAPTSSAMPSNADTSAVRAQPAPQVTLASLTADVQNNQLFEDHSKTLSCGFEAAWQAVTKLLSQQGDKIIRSEEANGVIVTDLSRHGVVGFPSYLQYYIVLERQGDNSTRLNLKLFEYYRDAKSRSSFGQVNLLPERNKFTAKKAQQFLDKIEAALGKAK